MTNYDQIKAVINEFADSYGQKAEIEASLSEISVNDVDSKNVKMLYETERKNMKVIAMDEVAHNVFRVARFPESNKDSDSPASADGFVINENNEWYFIEFKDQKISKAKESVIKKAYQNWHWLVDILYEMRDRHLYDTFNYENPIAFAKTNVVYILVVSEDKNYSEIDKIRKCILAGQKFQPEYMKKLEKYIFKDAYVYTPQLLEREFVKKFKY